MTLRKEEVVVVGFFWVGVVIVLFRFMKDPLKQIILEDPTLPPISRI